MANLICPWVLIDFTNKWLDNFMACPAFSPFAENACACLAITCRATGLSFVTWS